MSVKADLGVSPISCVPYVFSLKLPLTIGELTIIMNVLLILMQIILLRRNYRLIQLVQLPAVIVFGYFIDLALYMFSGLSVSSYGGQAFLCLLGCIVLAFGVFLEVKSDLTYLPGEGIVAAVAGTFKKDFGKVKIGVDSSMVIFGIISSFILLHSLEGIREGTILASLLVGCLLKFFSSKLPFLDRWLDKESAEKKLSATTADRGKFFPVITISREYGSGGRGIGQYIAKEMGISFYDRELIDLTAEQSGFTRDYIQQNELHRQKVEGCC